MQKIVPREDPIVIGGGRVPPQSGADRAVFDLFYMGEGEVVYFDLIDRYKGDQGARRQPEGISGAGGADSGYLCAGIL